MLHSAFRMYTDYTNQVDKRLVCTKHDIATSLVHTILTYQRLRGLLSGMQQQKSLGLVVCRQADFHETAC